MALLSIDQDQAYTIRRRARRSSVLIFLVAGFLLSSALLVRAQEPTPDLSRVAPPPIKVLSKEEKDQLASQTDTKKVTKIALALMESRMKKAEEADSQDNFDAMFVELGSFHALMDYTLAFLLDKHSDGKKAFNDFKRYELGLRGFTPRLELIRRDLPIKYEYYVRVLVKYLRDARSKAIDPLFGDSVVREKNN
jgi:hypothetical protein